MSGGTLTSRIQKHLDEDEIITISKEIAKGMLYVHSKNIIHRDLKPDNVLFGDDDVARIADFGISRTVLPSFGHRWSHPCGDPIYMAPEAYFYDISPKVDSFCFGLTLLEMVTGQQPFKGAQPEVILCCKKQGILPNIPADCSTKLTNLIRCCCQPNPNMRPGFHEIVKILK